MSRIWIDVEDASGNKLGDGPITTATEWLFNPRLDEAGTFSFSMPAGDERAALLQNKRVVRCYMHEDGEITEVGAGIIDSVVTDAREPTMLRVSGPDLLAELANRLIPDLAICEQDWVYLNNSHGLVRRVPNLANTNEEDLSEAYDGNPATTTAEFEIRDDWWLYIGYDTRFDRIRVNLDTVNDTYTATPQYQYYSSSESWDSLSGVSDGTIVSGRPFAQDGDITFTRPADWERIEPTAASGSWFWVRIRREPDVGDNFTISLNEIEVYADIPTTDGVNLIMAYAPDTWTQSGYTATTSAKYLELANESVLACLRALAEQGGQDGSDEPIREHFRLGTGREIDWLTSFTDSGLRAENASDPGADVCLVTDLRETRDTAEAVTRIYPYSNDGVGLALTTRTPPATYTLSTAEGYLESVNGVAALGRIDAALRFSDLSMQQTDSWYLHPAYVANAVYDRALEYLRTHEAEAYFYELELAHVRGSLVPGHTIRVIHHEYRDGYHAVDIDATLYVLGTRIQVDSDGLHTVGCEVGTVDRSSQRDVGVLVSTIQDVRRMQAGLGGVWNISLGSSGATGDSVLEGPGISVMGDAREKTVGLGGDSVLTYHGDGEAVAEHAPTSAGLDSALSAAASGDLVILPAMTIGGTKTIGSGIELLHRGHNSVLSGTIANNGIRSIPVVELSQRSTLVGPTAGNRTHTGADNLAIGYQAGLALTTGYRNIALGTSALKALTTGYRNIAIGWEAATQVTSGNWNVAIGQRAGYKWTTARYNVAIGHGALDELTNQEENVAIGYDAGADAQCYLSVIIGVNAGFALGYGTGTYENTAIGHSALYAFSQGEYAVALGARAMRYATGGDYNIGIGLLALSTVDPGGNDNVAVGAYALEDLSTGISNVAVGRSAGQNTITTGQYNTILGYRAQYHATSGYNASKSILLGYNAYTTADNTFVVGGAGADAVDMVIGGPTAASAQVHVDQAASDGAQPVLLLDQADVSEEFVRVIGAAAAATLTQSIVAEADVTTATRAGWLKVYVQDDGNQITDQAYYVPIYTLA